MSCSRVPRTVRVIRGCSKGCRDGDNVWFDVVVGCVNVEFTTRPYHNKMVCMISKVG